MYLGLGYNVNISNNILSINYCDERSMNTFYDFDKIGKNSPFLIVLKMFIGLTSKHHQKRPLLAQKGIFAVFLMNTDEHFSL